MKNIDLASKIWAAFAHSQYPGDQHLVCDLSNPVALATAQAFQGKKWNAVKFETLVQHQQGLPFFTPQAFRYYLPAYMLACVLQYKIAEMIPDTLLLSLTPPQSSSDLATFEETMRGFTSEQKAVILAYMNYMAEQHGYPVVHPFAVAYSD